MCYALFHLTDNINQLQSSTSYSKMKNRFKITLKSHRTCFTRCHGNEKNLLQIWKNKRTHGRLDTLHSASEFSETDSGPRSWHDHIVLIIRFFYTITCVNFSQIIINLCPSYTVCPSYVHLSRFQEQTVFSSVCSEINLMINIMSSDFSLFLSRKCTYYIIEKNNYIISCL